VRAPSTCQPKWPTLVPSQAVAIIAENPHCNGMATQQAAEWGTSSFGRLAQELTPWLNWWGATPPLPPRFEEAWALRLSKFWPWHICCIYGYLWYI
jgi:hypothetical protein